MSRIKGTTSQEILHMLLVGGAFILAAQSPYFWLQLYRQDFQRKGFQRKQMTDAFSYLKKKNLIQVSTYNHQIYIKLTPEGEKEAGKFQINRLVVRTPKRWDGVWRLIIFDIPEKLKIKREAFRGKLRELGFCLLQKSIWVYPYPCEKEVKLVREFFNLTPRHIRVLEVQYIEEDESLRQHFRIGK